MTFHGIFKKMVDESTSKKTNEKRVSVNEAYDDNALGWFTRNNILPQIFGGEMNGLRVRSAMLTDEKGKQIGATPSFGDGRKPTSSYPFVGIYGYADFPALAAKTGNKKSFISDKLRQISSDVSIRAILNKQVMDGTGIPENAFIIYPQMPLSSIGSRVTKRSTSNFNLFNLRDEYRLTTYPYNVQQALSVDENGRIFPDQTKAGGVVILPRSTSAQWNSAGMVYLSKLTMYDVYTIGCLDNRPELARQFTGGDRVEWPRVGGLLGMFMSNGSLQNNLRNGNPSYGKFDEFAKENGFITEDGEIDFLSIRQWILTADSEEIATKLLIPYLLKSPMENTYCCRVVTTSPDCPVKESDVAVFKALTEGNAQFEKGLEEIDSGEYDFEADDGEPDDFSESAPMVYGDEFINEAADTNMVEINESGMAKEMMAIFNYYISHHAPTIAIAPSQRKINLLRYDDRIKTKGSGVKRTFARIISQRNPLIPEIDGRFCPKEILGNMRVSKSGTLDYSPFFKKYERLLEQSAPQKFKYTRIVGYMISFEYDPVIEEEYKNERREKGFGTRGMGLLKHYIESPNSKMLSREPTVFDVTMIRSDEYGNFLFSGYGLPQRVNVVPMGEDDMQVLSSKNLLADNQDGLHSFMSHDFDRINLPSTYNRTVY